MSETRVLNRLSTIAAIMAIVGGIATAGILIGQLVQIGGNFEFIREVMLRHDRQLDSLECRVILLEDHYESATTTD